MRKKLVFMLAAAGLAIMICLPAVGAEVTVGQEMELNGGFEEWGADPGNGLWFASTFEKRGYTPAKAFRTGEGEPDTTHHSGRYAQYIYCDRYPQGIATSCKAQAGHHYRFSAWVKVTAGGWAGIHTISIPSYYLVGPGVKASSGDWQKLEMVVTCPEGENAVMFHLFAGGGVYLDDLSVQEVEEGPPVPVAVIKEIREKQGIKDERPAGIFAETITRKRIAIFSENGFPCDSPRNAEWYLTVLRSAGLKPTVIGADMLASAQKFSREQFDTLLIATGGYLPLSAEENIAVFMEQGGNVISDGSLFASENPAYGAYPFSVSQISRTPGRMRIRDSTGKWVPVRFPEWTDWVYYNQTEDFGLTLQYGRWRKLPAQAKLNPDLADILPAGLPRDITGGSGWVVPVQPVCSGYNKSAPADVTEFTYNIFIPVYLFSDVQNPDAADTDCFIYRYHSYRKNGCTLLQLGNIGSVAISSDSGGDFLLSMLRLAESRLPGEFDAEFYERRNAFRGNISLFYRAWVSADYALKDAALCSYYTGKKDSFDGFKEKLSELDGLLAEVVVAELTLKELDRFHDVKSDALRRQWLERLPVETAKLDRLSKGSLQTVKAEARPAVATDKKGTGLEWYADAMPSGARGLRHGYEALKEIGVSSSGHYTGGHQVNAPRLYRETGIGWDFYLTGATCILDDGPVDYDTFNPQTLKVSTHKADSLSQLFPDFAGCSKWMQHFNEVLDDLRQRGGLRVLRWYAEHRPGGGYYSPGYLVWGPSHDALFQDWLKKKYGDLQNLNLKWDTRYVEWKEIKIPLAFPVTAQDHALWEDWTKAREDSYINWWATMIGILHKQLPGVLISDGNNTIPGESRMPADACNNYRTSKYVDLVGTHYINTNPAYEWMVYDMVDGDKPCVSDEWGPLYTPAARYDENMRTVRQVMWSDLAAGSAGWTFFLWSTPGVDGCQFADQEGIIRLLGWDLKARIQEWRRFQHIITQGTGRLPEIGIIFSNTNRRHVARPDHANPAPNEISGLYQACLAWRVPANAVSEERIIEGKPITGKLLFLPATEYIPAELWEKIEEWVNSGGHLAATLPAATYDSYGERRDYVLSLAGYSLVRPASPVIAGPGWQYSSRMHEDLVRGFKEVVPGKSEVLFRYASGEAAVVRTRVGKGSVTVIGVPLGQDFLDYRSSQPQATLNILAAVAGGIKPDVFCGDTGLTLRERNYGGERYMIAATAQVSPMFLVDFSLAGAWRVRDVLLGLDVPASYGDGRTYVKGYVRGPGGIVYRLTPLKISPREEKIPASASPARTETRPAASKPADAMFSGFIEVDRDRIETDGFILYTTCRGGPGGPVIFTAEHLGQIHRIEPAENNHYRVRFHDCMLDVHVARIFRTFPVGCEVTVRQLPVPPADGGCRIREEKYFGRDSIILENQVLRVRLLPELGGRIAELTTLPEEQNHLRVGGQALGTPGSGSPGWDYGGIEFYEGYPGSIYKIRFMPEIIKNTADESVVVMRAGAVALAHSTVDMEQRISLKNGESRVSVELTLINRDTKDIPVSICTRPMLEVGGDVNDEDVAFIPTKEGMITEPVLTRRTLWKVFPSQGWCAFVDTDKQVAFTTQFDVSQISHVYLWMSAPGGSYDGYNLELASSETVLKPGERRQIKIKYGMVRGLRRIDGIADPLLAGILFNAPDTSGVVAGEVDFAGFTQDTAGGEITVCLADSAIARAAGTRAVFSVDTSKMGDGAYILNAEVQGKTFSRILTVKRKKSVDRELEAAQKKLEYARAYLLKRGKISRDELGLLVRGYNLLAESSDPRREADLQKVLKRLPQP